MNGQKGDDVWAREYQQWLQARTVEELMGVDEQLWLERVEARRLELERLKLGYGNMIYVPSLGSGSQVKMELGILGDIDHIMDSVDVLVVAEEGMIKPSCVSIDSMRETIMKMLTAQRRKVQKKKSH